MSSPGVEIRAGATQADVEELLVNMRQADRDECLAGGIEPRAGVENGVRKSTLLWTCRVDGELAFIMGVVPASLLGDTGIPWLLGTDLITRHGGAFVKRSGRYIRLMLQAYPHLTNYVHAQNRAACRWLRRAGFTLHAPVQVVSTGAVFHPFEMRA